ncbi:UDP-glucosyltransferase 2-like [Lasioglossum baleicum]|uniref:UDP-glucosyltransferase 2-like n=1 Tax=Lasioglossum baleicum TaxID=434251 RepID=UPI003FCE863B
MKFALPVLVLVIGLLCIVRQTEPARILALVPTPSYSHQLPHRRLLLELHKRGHEIVFVTPFPIPNVNSTTFKQVDLGDTAYKDLRSAVSFVKLRFDKADWLSFVENYLFDMTRDFTELALNHTDMQAIYAPNSNEKFDLVMAEMLTAPATFVFAHRFNAPLIGLSSLGLFTSVEHALGGLVLPSHESTWEMEENVGTNQSLWKRLHNFLKLSRYLYRSYTYLYPRHQELVEKYFGTDVPPMLEIQKNTSLIFVNQADPITPARPKLANMITYTSFHVAENVSPLPEDLKRFVDSATEGFIYFNLGSNAMSSDLPKETLQVFIDVFAKLPYKIVWKFEKDMPNKPDNVFIGKWLPQQSILGHPNVRMFIYQGGLQSSEEAVHFSVPLLGFPILADQDYQVRRMESFGVGKYMEITTVTRKELEAAILEILNNKRYKQRIVELKKLVNDNPYDMVEHLVWWTEYVIRHKGAPHLRSNLAHQPWYQRCDMDIVIFLTIVAVLIISNISSIIAKLAVRSYNHYRRISTLRKHKTS